MYAFIHTYYITHTLVYNILWLFHSPQRRTSINQPVKSLEGSDMQVVCFVAIV